MFNDSLARRQAPERLTIGGYQMIEELGRSAMSTVYRATRGGSQVAVKVMSNRSSTDSLTLRLQFRREAAAIARLNHPALVKVIESGMHDDCPYLVMELARGETLATRLLRGLLHDSEAVKVAVSIASGLTEVHKYHMVHRDIKPANIVVEDDLTATLIDFGMVADANNSAQTAGTLYYSAPEQIGVLSRPVDSAADLYALGATLFECLAGRPPFDGKTQSDLLHAIATRPASPLIDVRPQTSPALSQIVETLLRKDPDDRYQTASGLLKDLRNIAELDQTLRSGGELQLNTHNTFDSSTLDTPLIGRELEMSTLRTAWETASSGRGTTVQIFGEGGSGKTRLAQQLALEVTARGALALTGKCQEVDRTPFGPVREAVDRHIARVRRLPDHLREAQLARIRRAAAEDTQLVRRLSTGLAQVLGDQKPVRSLEPAAEQHRYYLALATFLSRLGTRESPLLLFLDDVQWLDDGSAQVLTILADLIHDGHALILSTSRPIVSKSASDYEAALVDFASVQVTLKPLDQRAIGQVIAERLGGRSLDDKTVQRLTHLTHGNPYALEEYLRTLLNHGIIQPTTTGWCADPELMDSVDLPDDVVELVLNRLHHLDQATYKLAQFAAISGARFTAHALCNASGTPLEAIDRALFEMSREGLIGRSFDNDWSFHHDRAREAIIEGMSDTLRRDVHQAFARSMDLHHDTAPEYLYTLARHYTAGHPQHAPDQTTSANLKAGLAAIEEHGYEQAFQMLSVALEVSKTAEMYDRIANTLLPALGRACAMTGRLDLAFEHLNNALEHATTKHERFRVHHLLTLTYASQGRNEEALDALYRSYEVIDKPFPRSRPAQIWNLAITWFLALFLRATRVGHGSAKGVDRERRKVESQLNYAGSMIALFQGDTLLMVQFIVRDFYNVHFLGPTAETAIASTVYGAVLGTFQLRSTMRYHTQAGVAMATQLGDRAALAVCHAYQAMGHKWSGDLQVGNDMLSEALPELSRFVPGSWYTAMMICEQAYSHMHAGRAKDAIAHIKKYQPELNHTNNLMFHYNTTSVEYCQTHVRGQVQPAAQMWSELELQWPALAKTSYVRLAKALAELEVLVDQNETGPAVQRAIALGQTAVGEDYYSNMLRLLVGYAHLIALEHGPQQGRADARRQLRKAQFALRIRAMVPVFSAHPHIWSAAIARIDGRFAKAQRHLNKAAAAAQRTQSPRSDYHILIERALLAQSQGEPTALFFAQRALQLARDEGWRHKALRVQSQFAIDPPTASADFARTRTSTAIGSRAQENAERTLGALLQVSLASTTSLDSDKQARLALESVARVLSAERAVFYLFDSDDGELRQKASTGSDDAPVSESVIRRVVDTREPVVITGDDHSAESLPSQSILELGLRSIMAAPLVVRDKMIGVVYVDSRLAKGMFTQDDVRLLLAVSNHIAIAMETARSARLEAERAVLQRDMDLVAVVQTLMLPKSHTIRARGLRGCGFYQSAGQCGGDWWWNQTLPDGSTVLWMGDVSGHGAAPAMITSAIAGAFHTLIDLRPDASPDWIMQQLSRRVAALGGGFHMTMTAVQIDDTTDQLTLWNAGGPAVFVTHQGKLQPLSTRGTVLGHPGPMTIGRVTHPFLSGDRLFMCTDGVLELRTANRRELGARGVAQMLRQSQGVSIDELHAHMSSTLNAARRGEPQLDDITFIAVQRTPPTLTQETS